MNKAERHKAKVLEIAKPIYKLMECLNIATKMTDSQILEAARRIVKLYPEINPYHVEKALDPIAEGKVTLYNFIDVPIIISVVEKKMKAETRRKRNNDRNLFNSNSYLSLLYTAWNKKHPESYQRFKNHRWKGLKKV